MYQGQIIQCKSFNGKPQAQAKKNCLVTDAELQSLRNSVKRGFPFGDSQGTKMSDIRLGLGKATRPREKGKE